MFQCTHHVQDGVPEPRGGMEHRNGDTSRLFPSSACGRLASKWFYAVSVILSSSESIHLFNTHVELLQGGKHHDLTVSDS